MKLILDTINKTIQIEEVIQLNDLFETLEQLLPNGLWKEFTLEQKPIITTIWKDPIVIEKTNPFRDGPWYPSVPTYPTYPNQPFWCSSGGDLIRQNVYCLDVTKKSPSLVG